MSERVTWRELEAAVIRMESRAISSEGMRRDATTLIAVARRVLYAKPASGEELRAEWPVTGHPISEVARVAACEGARWAERRLLAALLDEEPPK